MEQEETIEYFVGSQTETLGHSWTGCVIDNLRTIRDNRTTNMPKSLANEDVFETTDDSLAVSVQNQLQTLEGQKTLQETLREYLGPLSRKYVGVILIGDKGSNMDRMYGVYLDKDGIMFGSKRFNEQRG